MSKSEIKKWEGGAIPVAGDTLVWVRNEGKAPSVGEGQRVLILFADGSESETAAPLSNLRWKRIGSAGDIVAYKVSPLDRAGLGDSHVAQTFGPLNEADEPPEATPADIRVMSAAEVTKEAHRKVVEGDQFRVAHEPSKFLLMSEESLKGGLVFPPHPVVPRTDAAFCPGNTDANGEGKQTNPKDLIGSRKAKLSVIPAGVLFDLGNAMTEGMVKYGRHNYRHAGVRSSVYYDAAVGHMADWWEGQDIDPESGLSHVTKAIASLVVLRDAMMQGMLKDDRPPRSKVFKADFSPMTAQIIDRHADKSPRHFTIADTVQS